MTALAIRRPAHWYTRSANAGARPYVFSEILIPDVDLLWNWLDTELQRALAFVGLDRKTKEERASLRRLFDLAMSNSSETGLWTLIYNNTAWANVGNAGGLQPSGAAGSFFTALHTASLTGSSTQATTEAAYTGYARVGVARSSAGWTITGNAPVIAENTAATTFGACTAGSETETWFSTGLVTSGATAILIAAALTASLAVSAGITPSFAINQLQNNLT